MNSDHQSEDTGVAQTTDSVLTGRAVIIVVTAGLLTGAFASATYYSASLRSLSHAFVIWILLAAVLARGRKPVAACVRVTLALVAAVWTFYLGRAVIYQVLYSAGDDNISLFKLLVWTCLALIAGTVLGLGLRFVGEHGWKGVTATGGAIGLVWGDILRRTGFDLLHDPVLVVLAAVVCALLLAIGTQSPTQFAWTGLVGVLLIAPGYLLASMPDLLEQLLITGGLSGIL
ncbi:hypothetical protein DI005_37830 [Prauserella sp. PE36]|uniref:hypothetical protein n=1 Tax=Prauserella sp. PE36 TaxID=1504709 RepID=UPI000DE532F1|nr:hypothetical protein [Prauserella sp. PE36]RBM10341.1 hypothetical protein DI005_37830 [Prauserella sp. PE36]